MTRQSSRATTIARAMTAMLTATGILHFVKPRPFVAIVPRSLPRPELLVALSGVAELGTAALLALPRTRRLGGLVAAATFVAVFPANVSMALRSGSRPVWYRVATWARLPLQAPLVIGALGIARNAR